jgi:predicted RNase H-like nuclease (RuvC/YqgF family)
MFHNLCLLQEWHKHSACFDFYLHECAESADLQQELDQQEAANVQLNLRLGRLSLELQSEMDKVKAKDAQIEELERKLADSEAHVMEMEEKLEEVDNVKEEVRYLGINLSRILHFL